MRGVTTAFLKEFGKDPSMRGCFTNLVIEERRISRQSLRRNYVHPTGGGHIIFACSAVRRPASGVPLGFQTF